MRFPQTPALRACLAFCVMTVPAMFVREVNGTELPPIPYTTACGPIAMYVALRSLGTETTLGQLIHETGWRDDSPMTLRTMYAGLSRYRSVSVQTAKLTPDQLSQFVRGDGVAILAVRKNANSLNHAICVVGAADGALVYIDYPELKQKVYPEALTSIWDGHALLLTPRTLRWRSLWFGWYIIPALASIVLMTTILRSLIGLKEVPT